MARARRRSKGAASRCCRRPLPRAATRRRFGTWGVTAVGLPSDALVCAAPRAPPGEKFNLALALALEVSANGGADWSASGVPFAYRTVPRVIDAAPLWGGTPGGTRITVLLMASVHAVGPVAGGPPGGGTLVTVRGAGFSFGAERVAGGGATGAFAMLPGGFEAPAWRCRGRDIRGRRARRARRAAARARGARG